MARDDATREAERRIGTVLGDKYELLALIAVGGTGAVFRARHRFTDRPVAVKLLREDMRANREAVARFMREARAASKLSHPSIAQVLDAGETEDGHPYLVQELLTGRDLFDAIEEGELGFDRVVRIGIQLLHGLAAAHDLGIVHRDVKPENVFLVDTPDRSVSVKLLDFGLAKSFGGGASLVITAPGRTVGTPWYMSPEQVAGGSLDARTDIWSVGAGLFHAAAHEPPFDAPEVLALMTKIVRTRAPLLADACPTAPRPLIDAVDRALEPAANKRWATARDMAACLAR